MSNNLDCKYYVCSKKKQECIAFDNKIEYFQWYRETKNKKDYIYSPICDQPTILHNLILCLRHQKHMKLVSNKSDNKK
jgi:hypothetical protein